ncbi:hypothetical protein TSAR_003972 [Trichomalopsis sarcophagae]|uniref:Uncharacterized protein n=1 Tax=Trichomalopsis sarcophagae TaxID=543379 RepID=A0A232EJL3_9HYME|nr:hypothetical protein TSAR_003972 [Trichomalopsis sarcophagae]
MCPRERLPFFLNLTSEFGVISADPLPISSKLRIPAASGGTSVASR